MSTYYRSYNQYLKEQFPCKVYKVAIDAGFSCPNIDGTVAYGGCTYCDNKSFSPNSRVPPRIVRDQVLDGMEYYRRRFGAEKFIVYFQAFSNTHAPVDRLRRLYDEAFVDENVVGLAIGTRPDCVPEEVLDLLVEYSAGHRLWVEYGLQTIYDATLEGLNRGHTFAQFVDAVERTHRRRLPICAHVILGLPGETRAMMMETAETVSRLPIDSLKIHHLYIAKNTVLEKTHRQSPIPVLTLDEYISLVCDFVERMPPSMVIQRLMGELNETYVSAPQWGMTKGRILKQIDEEFERRGTTQGACYNPPST